MYSVHTHVAFDRIFAADPPIGMEVGCRGEGQKSANSKSERAEALVKPSANTPHFMGPGPGRFVKRSGPANAQRGAAHIDPMSLEPWPGTHIPTWNVP